MIGYPLTLGQIVSWYRSKQSLLAGSAVCVSKITERPEDLPAAAADFNGVDAMGRINGWVSGEFDFEAVRVSDGKDIFWRHIDVSAVEALEDVYVDFIHSLSEPGPSPVDV
jgi:hypothetical protein